MFSKLHILQTPLNASSLYVYLLTFLLQQEHNYLNLVSPPPTKCFADARSEPLFFGLGVWLLGVGAAIWGKSSGTSRVGATDARLVLNIDGHRDCCWLLCAQYSLCVPSTADSFRVASFMADMCFVADRCCARLE